MKSITARFESQCPNCRKLIAAGTLVYWERGAKAVHIACPQPTVEDRAAAAVDAAYRTENLPATIELFEAVANGDAEGSAQVAIAALDLIEERLTAEYDRLQANKATPQEADRLTALAAIRKGIYRASLTGLEKKYGTDYVNVNLVPNEKFGSVVVSEWQGQDVGYIDRNGRLNYWRARPATQWSDAKPAVDPTSPRVQAVVAALDVILGSADPIEYAKAYARESSTCWRCGADLVDELSTQTLMGATCYRATYGKTQRQGLKAQAEVAA